MAAGKVYVWRIHSRGEITAVAISDSSFIFFPFTLRCGIVLVPCSVVDLAHLSCERRRVGCRVAWRHALSLSRVPVALSRVGRVTCAAFFRSGLPYGVTVKVVLSSHTSDLTSLT